MTRPRRRITNIKKIKKNTMKIEFTGETPFVKTFKSNRDSYRVEIDTGKYSLEAITQIMQLSEDKTYKITIEEA